MRWPQFVVTTSLLFLLAAAARAQSPPPLLRSWSLPGIPGGIAIDHDGHVAVTDYSNNHVLIYSSAGDLLGQWGSPGMGQGQLYQPYGITFDSHGNVVVCDGQPESSLVRIQVFTQTGVPLRQWGHFGSDPGGWWVGVALHAAANGEIYLVDNDGKWIDVFDESGNFLRRLGGYPDLMIPSDCALSPANEVLVAEPYYHRVEVYSTSGSLLRAWGAYGHGPGQLNGPFDIALDNLGYVYILDQSAVRVFNTAGAFVMQWGSYGSGPGQFMGIGPLALDAYRNLYVCDQGVRRIQVFGPLDSGPTALRPGTWGGLKASYR